MPKDPLRLGSVVTDARRGPTPLRVVASDHRSAGDHPDVDVDRPENLAHGVEPDDAVYECVFLPDADDDRVSGPRKAYAFPESVLSRVRCEAALEDGARRLHTQIVREAFAALLATAKTADDVAVEQVVRDMIIAANGRLECAVPSEVLLSEADELAEAVVYPGGEAGAE